MEAIRQSKGYLVVGIDGLVHVKPKHGVTCGQWKRDWQDHWLNPNYRRIGETGGAVEGQAKEDEVEPDKATNAGDDVPPKPDDEDPKPDDEDPKEPEEPKEEGLKQAEQEPKPDGSKNEVADASASKPAEEQEPKPDGTEQPAAAEASAMKPAEEHEPKPDASAPEPDASALEQRAAGDASMERSARRHSTKRKPDA